MLNKIRHIPHSVTTPIGCKKFGGRWDTSYGFSRGVCVMNERCTKENCVGWTAPVHGLYFVWGAEKFDGEEEEYANDAFAAGCIVKDNPNYPDDPDPCRIAIPLNPMDWYFEHDMTYKEIAEHAKGYALSAALDFYNTPSNELYRNIEFFDKQGRRMRKYNRDTIPMLPDSGYGDGETPLRPERPGFKLRRQR